MHIAFAEPIAVVLLPIFPEFVDQIESDAHCFVCVVGTSVRKSEDGHDAFSVRSLNIAARLEEKIGSSTNKLLSSLGKKLRLSFLRHVVFISNIADHDRDLVGLRLNIQRNVAFNQPADLLG